MPETVRSHLRSPLATCGHFLLPFVMRKLIYRDYHPLQARLEPCSTPELHLQTFKQLQLLYHMVFLAGNTEVQCFGLYTACLETSENGVRKHWL